MFLSKKNKEEKEEIELETAQRQAKRVVNEALDEAALIVREAELFRGRMEKEFNDVLKNKIKEISKNSEDFLERANAYYAELVEKSNARIEEAVAGKVEKLSENFTQQLLATQAKVVQEQEDAQKIIRERVEKSEQEYMKDLKEKIGKRLPEIIAKTAGRSISLRDHEELLMSALLEAKNYGVWKD